MREMTDRQQVGAQYASVDRLETRRSVWGPGPDGVSPVDVLRTLVVSSAARRVIEIGCGTGQFARSVLDEAPGTDYVATDLSPAMVEATRALGVTAEMAPADALPFPDGSFDGAVAAWMLYHVPDLDRTLAELRRVLRQGSRLFVATNGREHLADLLRAARHAVQLRERRRGPRPSLRARRAARHRDPRDLPRPRRRPRLPGHLRASARRHAAALRRTENVCRPHRRPLGALTRPTRAFVSGIQTLRPTGPRLAR